MTKPIDISNVRFGKLVTIKQVGNDAHGSKLWLCECDCGNTTIVNASDLRRGNTKSCGCLSKDNLVKRNLKHGLKYSRLYYIHQGMKQRCLNPNNKSYKDYGAKGITVCSDWLDFENFHRWAMANGYSDKLTIDRIDCCGNYEPGNCRWVTAFRQASNKKNNHYIEWMGEKHTLAEWSRITGIESSLLRYRLKKGMELDKVFYK